MKTIPVYINLVQAGLEDDEELELLDLEVSHSGELQEVYVSGIKVDGQVDVVEFITLLIGQENLFKMVEIARSKMTLDEINEPRP